MITLLGEGSVRSSSQLGRATRGLQVRVPQYWGPRLEQAYECALVPKRGFGQMSALPHEDPFGAGGGLGYPAAVRSTSLAVRLSASCR
jgi:hypothetical protein